MTYLEAFLLSLLQGATEFLPVSSSGHLVIAQERFGLQGTDNIAFGILVHMGTLLAIFVFFRRKLGRILSFAFGEGWRLTREEGFRRAWSTDARGRLILAIIIATIPTALIGFLGKSFFEHLYESPEAVKWTGFSLCLTALLLASTFRRGRRSGAPETPLGDADAPFPFRIAFCVGVIQAVAIAPGLSRSGSTISIALLLGMNRRMAGEFSFLIAIPAILGAVVLEAPELAGSAAGLSAGLIALALLVSAVSGYFFLRLLIGFVRSGALTYFSLYCMALGLWAILTH